jgi:zinc/manganese transport system permease protein
LSASPNRRRITPIDISIRSTTHVIAAVAPEPKLTWDVVTDVRQLFDFPFMVNALRAGTIVAIIAGAVGWFMVLRRQTFAGHTLALIGFPGGAGAVLIGLSAQLGFFAFCIGGALAIALLGDRTRSQFSNESAVIGLVQAFALGTGFLFVSLYGGNLNRINSLLFGTFIGVSEGDVIRLLTVALLTIGIVAVVGRPLLFASVDPDVAAARGVPVRALSIVFLVLLGGAAAACAQITGSLLVFALLVLPPATAHALTARPGTGLLLSVALAVTITWFGLGVAYYSPYPIGFWITTFAFGLFVIARLAAALARSSRWRLA